LTIDFYVVRHNDLKKGAQANVVPYVLYAYLSTQQFRMHRFNVSVKPITVNDRTVLVPFQPAIYAQDFRLFYRPKEEDDKTAIDGKVCEFAFDVVLA